MANSRRADVPLNTKGHVVLRRALWGGLLGCKCQFVDVNAVRRYLLIAIDLIVDGDTVPARACRRVVTIKSCRLAIQRNCVEEKFASGGALNLKGQMVPGIADWVARDASWDPVFLLIIPSVPLISPKNPAFMTPYIRLAADELVDIKLKRLRVVNISYPEVNVVGEVVQVGDDGLICVFKALRGHAAD